MVSTQVRFRDDDVYKQAHLHAKAHELSFNEFVNRAVKAMVDQDPALRDAVTTVRTIAGERRSA